MSVQWKLREWCCNSALADKTYPWRQIFIAIIRKMLILLTLGSVVYSACTYNTRYIFLKRTWRPVNARGKQVGTATDLLFVLLISFRDREPPILCEALDAHFFIYRRIQAAYYQVVSPALVRGRLAFPFVPSRFCSDVPSDFSCLSLHGSWSLFLSVISLEGVGKL